MGLISSGISKVRAFWIPLGIRESGSSVSVPRTALVRWHSGWTDKLYQVYVNSRYAGTTVDSEQRYMLVQVPTSSDSPVRIEVFAVEADEADCDYSEELDETVSQSGRVRIEMLRSQDLPAGATVQIYFDNGTGVVDYSSPLNNRPLQVWPNPQDKGGFGMSSFGAGDFGYDGSAVVGFGKGVFGRSWFGFDADTFEWVSEPLPVGTYKFGVKVTDKTGRESAARESCSVTVIPGSKPVEELGVSSFDKDLNELVLNLMG
ncbi:MAG TPA: hypothetical protein HPP87_13100 [Planctomycetes bacterium]|nr:hypothetical protein [Planctomycetota bacterium]